VKHKQKHQIAPATTDGTRLSSVMGERAMFLFLFVCLIAGIGIGYLLRGIMSPTTVAPTTPSVTMPRASNEALPASFDSAVEPLEATLKADPQNAKVLIELGNLYYDHHVYSTATAYYQRALQLNPRDVNVRTDLGTAYAYSGRPKQAVAEYDKALAINPRHFRTLFNLGVVYETGLEEPARAIAAWQKLLKLYPQDPSRNRIENLIQSAKRQEGAPAMPR
jgi:cytochrome c-type biogenesis protein CcmH/NrfG